MVADRQLKYNVVNNTWAITAKPPSTMCIEIDAIQWIMLAGAAADVVYVQGDTADSKNTTLYYYEVGAAGFFSDHFVGSMRLLPGSTLTLGGQVTGVGKYANARVWYHLEPVTGVDAGEVVFAEDIKPWSLKDLLGF